MHDSIRYPASYIRMGNDSTKFLYCNRERCNTKLILQEDEYADRLPEHAIAVNVEDGESTYYFCSAHCASLWLSVKTYTPRRSWW
jgi:hypothetical protein